MSNKVRMVSSLIQFSFLVYTIGLFADKSCSHVNYAPYLDTSFEYAINKVGALPILVPYSKNQLQAIFKEFIRGKSLEESAQCLDDWSSGFFASALSKPWQGSHYRFGIFGGAESTHKKSRLIQGINCKMCREYCDWIFQNKQEELAKRPYLTTLLQRLIDVDEKVRGLFLDKIEEIGQKYPEVNKIFYDYGGEPRLALSIRLIRFEYSEQFSLPLHFDISVMTLIFPSDDESSNECLILAPADGSEFKAESLKKALRPLSEKADVSCTLMISGTQLNDLKIPILPTPHGVLPHYRNSRCVMVVCLHVPNIDTSMQSALLPKLISIPNHLKSS